MFIMISGGKPVQKKSIWIKLRRNLAYRIMSVILVTFVPLCLVTVIIAGTAMYTSSERLHDKIHQQTQVNLGLCGGICGRIYVGAECRQRFFR